MIFSHQVHAADIVGAGCLGLVRLVALGEHQDADGLAGAVGQNDGAADLLVSVTGVNAQLDVQLDGLVELGGSGLARPGPGRRRDRTARRWSISFALS